jgi:thiol-disulfide isomerase/thioredoxin
MRMTSLLRGYAVRKVTLAVLALLLSAAATADPLALGTATPNDLGKTLKGQAIRTSSLRGKVVVISFWATWCKYCMREMPILGGLQAVAHRRKLPLQVVEINYEEDHSTFVRVTHLLMPKLPGLLLTWDRTGAIDKSFGFHGSLPTMIMVSRDGRIADEYVGYDKTELDSIVAEINKLLNEPAPPPPTATRSVPASITEQH